MKGGPLEVDEFELGDNLASNTFSILKMQLFMKSFPNLLRQKLLKSIISSDRYVKSSWSLNKYDI